LKAFIKSPIVFKALIALAIALSMLMLKRLINKINNKRYEEKAQK
jgi:hypothetical protein